MATNLLHLVTDRTHPEEVEQCVLLASRLPEDEVRHRVVVVGRYPKGLTLPADERVIHERRGWPLSVIWRRKLKRVLDQFGPALVYAWGRDAIESLCRLAPDRSWVGLLANPAEAAAIGGCLKESHGKGMPMRWVSMSEVASRRLIEAGAPADIVEVIRPGVDSQAVDVADGTAVREALGVGPKTKLLLTPAPPSKAGGQFFAIWGAAILQVMWPEVRLVVPGTSREQVRLHRFGESVYMPEAFLFPGDRFSSPELLAASDALVVPATADIPTGWLAVAMMAGVPIVGSTVDAVTELIEDEQSGFLCGPGDPQKVAIRLRQLFERHEQRGRCVGAAKDRASRLFSIETCLSRHLELLASITPKHRTMEGS